MIDSRERNETIMMKNEIPNGIVIVKFWDTIWSNTENEGYYNEWNNE